MATPLSTCCSAPIYDDTDICSDCKEHCDIANRCSNCNEPAELVEETFDYAGTHCNHGIGGTHHTGHWVTDCCSADLIED